MLSLTKNQRDKLIEHAKQGYPNEVCGILAGNDGKVKKIYQMANTDNSRVSFFMEPKEQFRVMKEMRQDRLEMVAIYHSHPDTQASPSARDVELAYYPDASYVIVSIRDKENPNIRSFRILDGGITEEEVKIG